MVKIAVARTIENNTTGKPRRNFFRFVLRVVRFILIRFTDFRLIPGLSREGQVAVHDSPRINRALPSAAWAGGMSGSMCDHSSSVTWSDSAVCHDCILGG